MNSVIIVTVISFVLSIIIVIVNNIFKIRTTKKQREILKLLPGVNCGVCGYVTCEGMCKALMDDSTVITKCKIIKEEELESIRKLLK